MSDAVVGVLYFPWGADYGADKQAGSNPTKLWRRLVVHKANPRSADYMRRRFAQAYPAGELVEVTRPGDTTGLTGSAGLVVLLYPDAIGLGFGRLEGALRRVGRKDLRIRVLNGRGRDYELTAAIRRRLLARRALERTMLLEIVATPLVIAAAFGGLALDLARGRR